ncbi:hypothetical protein [Helicobacter macacae]|nr:hypothetical protein [Helicobacter macacae]
MASLVKQAKRSFFSKIVAIYATTVIASEQSERGKTSEAQFL